MITVHPPYLEHGYSFDEEAIHGASLAITKAANRYPSYDADIFLGSRVPGDAPRWRNPGFIEHMVVLRNRETGRRGMTIGVIQRHPGQPWEFHS